MYALSKKNNEELAKIYSSSYSSQFLALRFFTVFGELGRPDMFFFKSLNSIFKNKKLHLNNSGDHYRDFTYIKDVVKIIEKLISCKLEKSFYSINICSSKPIHLKKFIKIIDKYSKKINLVNVPAHLLMFIKHMDLIKN